MKKAISIVLIISFLGGNFHLDELTRLPFLIQHYNEHKNVDSSLTFAAFIWNHYFKEIKPFSDSDRKSDSQLPYKAQQKYHAHFTPFAIDVTNVKLISFYSEKEFIPYPTYRIQIYSIDIWQPPRI